MTTPDKLAIAALGCVIFLALIVALVFVFGHIAERRENEKLNDWKWPE